MDQDPEHAAAVREVTDGPVRLLVDPAREEALEVLAPLVEHANGRKAGSGQLLCDLEQLVEHGFWIELGDERPPDVEQTPQSDGVHGAMLPAHSSSLRRITRVRGSPHKLRGAFPMAGRRARSRMAA